MTKKSFLTFFIFIFFALFSFTVSSSVQVSSSVISTGKTRPNLPPFAGRCEHFPWAHLWYEICWFKIIRQNDGYDRSYITGFFKGWEKPTQTSNIGVGITKSYSQLYENGESCDEFGARRTRVTLSCTGSKGSKNKLLKVEENQACKYLLTVEIDASICDTHFSFLTDEAAD